MSTTQEYDFELGANGTLLDVHLSVPKFVAARVPVFQAQLEEAWENSIERVRIFMGDVAFIDSSGIGALLAVQKKIAEVNEAIELHTSQSNVISILELLRLQRGFHIISE